MKRPAALTGQPSLPLRRKVAVRCRRQKAEAPNPAQRCGNVRHAGQSNLIPTDRCQSFRKIPESPDALFRPSGGFLSYLP